MALKGWILKDGWNNYFKFEKREPQEIFYHVEIDYNESLFSSKFNPNTPEDIEESMEKGWVFVSGSGKINIYIMQIIINHNNFENINEFTIPILISPILSIQIISFIKWIIKAKLRLKKNEKIDFYKLKDMRRKSFLIALISLIYFAVYSYQNTSSNLTFKIVLLGNLIAALIISIIFQWKMFFLSNKPSNYFYLGNRKFDSNVRNLHHCFIDNLLEKGNTYVMVSDRFGYWIYNWVCNGV